MISTARRVAPIVVAATMSAAWLSPTGEAANQTLTRSQQAWRAAIAHKPVPAEGCFTASYPAVVWRQVECGVGPRIPLLPAAGNGWGRAGGNGDYEATTAALTSAAMASFPVVKHLRWENDSNSPNPANSYSLQLNSNYLTNDKRCASASTPDICYGWQQFVYSSTYGYAFMQYWLVYYNPTTSNPCPPGWFSPGLGNCFKNSATVAVPLQVITELPNMSLSGSAVFNGMDTLVLTTATQAYSVTGKDNVVFLARGWNSSEFNVLGEGGGSQAQFNPGTSLTLQVDVTDKGRKPSCGSNPSTTAETNNLTLGACVAAGGGAPKIRFVESD